MPLPSPSLLLYYNSGFLVERLLLEGATPNSHNEDGLTPLHQVLVVSYYIFLAYHKINKCLDYIIAISLLEK